MCVCKKKRAVAPGCPGQLLCVYKYTVGKTAWRRLVRIEITWRSIQTTPFDAKTFSLARTKGEILIKQDENIVVQYSGQHFYLSNCVHSHFFQWEDFKRKSGHDLRGTQERYYNKARYSHAIPVSWKERRVFTVQYRVPRFPARFASIGGRSPLGRSRGYYSKIGVIP